MNDSKSNKPSVPLVNGALFLPSVVSVQTVKALVAEIDQGLSSIANRVGASLDNIERVTTAWGRQCDLIEKLVSMVQPMLRAALLESGEDVLEPVDATLFVVSHLHPIGTHAHQDIAYRWNRPETSYALTTWLALDPCNEQRGALLFSNAFPNRPVEERQDFLSQDFIDKANTPKWKHRQVVASAEPGDVVVFDSGVWHAAANYTPTGRRRALAIRWSSKSDWEHQIEIPKPAIDPHQFGMDTSGRLLTTAIRSLWSDCPMRADHGDVRKCIDAFLQKQPSTLQALDPSVILHLQDLSLALCLLEEHGARPSGSIWSKIRDEVIPALQTLNEQEADNAVA